jgi:hypothetical protein
MKYWNKTKEVRLRCWTKIPCPFANTRDIYEKIPCDQYAEIKKWCQDQPGGRFFNDVEYWWFERPADASWFTMTWL